MTDAFVASDHLITARTARLLPLALLDGRPRRDRSAPRPLRAAGRGADRGAGSRLARAFALVGLAALTSGCSAGMGLVSVPLVGSVPIGDVAPLTQMSMMSGMSVAELEEQCAIMAGMVADPSQPQQMRTQMSQSMGMMGCPG